MSTVISIAIILVCILLILIVLVQNSKGGGLASSFSSSNQVMGVRKTADFLEKATWSLATALLVLSLLSAAYNKPADGTNAAKTESATRKVGENAGNNAAPIDNTTLPDTTK
ncbi:MAG: preprotein translocase, SecG subunit [Bacteroidota bacterium]|jgi:preprotein translocase subunit SecG|nr:preprotein translocase, SecG subunit [Bacteroidota bacterium]